MGKRTGRHPERALTAVTSGTCVSRAAMRRQRPLSRSGALRREALDIAHRGSVVDAVTLGLADWALCPSPKLARRRSRFESWRATAAILSQSVAEAACDADLRRRCRAGSRRAQGLVEKRQAYRPVDHDSAALREPRRWATSASTISTLQRCSRPSHRSGSPSQRRRDACARGSAPFSTGRRPQDIGRATTRSREF